MAQTLYLVRHARPKVDPSAAPGTWPLDASARADAADLRRSSTIPATANWFSSPERKAVETATAMTESQVEIDDGLRECERTWLDDPGEFRSAVESTLTEPDKCPYPGWESGAHATARLAGAVGRIVDRHRDDVVLVGHGTAWTLLVAFLTSTPATPDAWMRWHMPDLRRIELREPVVVPR